MKPVEFKILVKMDRAEHQVGNIFLPDQTRERHQYAIQKGTVVALGGGAFTESGFTQEEIEQIQPGCRVMVNKYAGAELTIDREMHRVMNDKDIIGILEEGE